MEYDKVETANLADALIRRACTHEGTTPWKDSVSISDIREIVNTEEKIVDIIWNLRYNNSNR